MHWKLDEKSNIPVMNLLPALIQASQKILDLFCFVTEDKLSTEHLLVDGRMAETHTDP